MPLTETEFRDALNMGIEQRVRDYASAFTLHVRFQHDDTNAFKDAEHFKSICHAFGLPPPEEIIIAPKDPAPAWTIQPIFGRLLVQARQNPRSLILVHYSGHGNLSPFGTLIFQANAHEPRSFQFTDAFLNHIGKNSDFQNHDPAVDVVLIIDSCFSGAATRAVSNVSRVVEILAACGSDKSTFGNPMGVRTQNRTFTAKLASLVARQKGKGQAMSFAEMMSVLRSESPQIKPFYELHLGSSSVRLPFATATPAPTRVPSSAATYRAVFSVHLAGELSDDKVCELVRWIRELDKTMGITVDSVYRTASIGIVMEAPYFIYAQLRRLPGIEMLFENTGGNLLGQLDGIVSEMSQVSVSPSKENVKMTSK